MTKDLVRLEYISGKTRKELCKRYQVKYDTLDKWILRGNWTKEKRQIVRKTSDRLTTLTANTLAELQREWNDLQFKKANLLIEILESQILKTTKPKDRLRLLKSFWIVYQIGRQAINLDYAMK
jgi:transposase